MRGDERFFGGAVIMCMLLGASRAHGQTSPSSEPNQAEQEADRLFKEGNRLMARGAYRDACPKLERSQELDPGVGTQFNLANCYELTERPARAYKVFREVERIARAAGKQERAESARQRAAAIAPRVPQLQLTAKEPVEWKVDGDTVRPSSEPLFVDPGAHEVVASAAGKRPWTGSVNVPKDAHVVLVLAPPLDDEAVPPAVAPPVVTAPPLRETTRPHRATWSTQRTFAVVAAGVGVVGLGAGTYFGLASKSDHDDAQRLCGNRDACSSHDGVAKWDDATRNGTIATIAVAAGGLALIAGGILWFTAPRTEPAKSVRVIPNVTGTHAGLIVSGPF